MRYIALLALALALAACGGTTHSTAQSAPSSAPASSAVPGLSSAQGKSVCQDIATWIPQADNQDMPRFSTQLETDESEAGNTPLGQDMTTLDDNLQSENGNALISNNYVVTGSPDPITGLSQDCNGYGVTLNWNS
jgi:hypothetical protein